MQPHFRGAGLDTVFLVSPTSPRSRMAEAARLSSGFLYVVSRSGTTGARQALPRDLPRTVQRARKAAGRLPVAIGFGIATPETARRAASLADGVVVGSALVRAAEDAGNRREEAVELLARSLALACRRGPQ
jgi:tryptophan synthase alpha chain